MFIKLDFYIYFWNNEIKYVRCETLLFKWGDHDHLSYKVGKMKFLILYRQRPIWIMLESMFKIGWSLIIIQNYDQI